MEEVIISQNIFDWIRYPRSGYLPHIFCLNGTVSFSIGNKTYRASKNDCIIPSIMQDAGDIVPSEDFQCCIMFLSNEFVKDNAPDSSYRVKGHLGMIQNPILPLLPTETQHCLDNVETIRQRYSMSYHTFYRENLRRAFEIFVFDLYDIHARQGSLKPSEASQSHILIRRFISLLQEGSTATQRSPSHYAEVLCITPVYLTEICRTVTHHTPTYWIDYFAGEEIKRLLADKTLTLSAIASQLNFSSLSYFSRYCKRIFGKLPSRMR